MAAKHDNADLDLDLFDFPVIEMTLEGVKEVKPEDVAASTEAVVSAAVATPAAVEAAKPAASAPAPAAPAGDVAAVAKAVALVESIERAAPELLAPAAATSGPSRPNWNQKAVLALGGLVLLLNAGIGLLAWRTTTTVGAGVETMREELALNADRLARQNERIAELARQRDAAVAAAADATAPLPALEAFDATALRLARQEIDLGRAADARLRINRLLARIDAVDADRRADVEAEAVYLLAQSLQSQADLKRSDAR